MKSLYKGFTLVELLLATAILALVLTGILALFINCVFLNEANRNLAIATSHAQYIMEEIRDTDFDSIDSAITGETWDLSENEIKSPPYNLTALIDEQIDTNITQSGNPLGVSVRVSWTDRGQRARVTELRTYMTDYQ